MKAVNGNTGWFFTTQSDVKMNLLKMGCVGVKTSECYRFIFIIDTCFFGNEQFNNVTNVFIKHYSYCVVKN